jgi:hypothetical protein
MLRAISAAKKKGRACSIFTRKNSPGLSAFRVEDRRQDSKAGWLKVKVDSSRLAGSLADSGVKALPFTELVNLFFCTTILKFFILPVLFL